MEWSIMPLQAVQNNKSSERHYSPQKRNEKGSFAELLGHYLTGGNTVTREEGYSQKQKNYRKPFPLNQSDIDALRMHVSKVNMAISSIFTK